jgi:hypothetical protein
MTSFRALCVTLLVAASSAIGSSAFAQGKPPQIPYWADTVGESDVYPVGDAVGVYRAVLDLLYVDGKDRPGVIVLWDSAMWHSQGPAPCPRESCGDRWLHESQMDTSTILGLARQSGKRPRIVDFGYRIPIALVSQDDFQRLRNDGYGYLADLPPEKVGFGEAMWAGFMRKYPGAWGYVMLSKVGFNTSHTEALMTVFQVCGVECRSNEYVFLRRIGSEWRVIERITDYTDGRRTGGNLRYRGPAAENSGHSQIVASVAPRWSPRAESDDAEKIYTAILDRLYSFYGEAPQQIVLTDRRAWGPPGLPDHHSRIDSTTIAGYNVFSQIRDAAPHFNYRRSITWVNDSSLERLARDGASLADPSASTYGPHQSPLWYGFRAKYPGAWGYASLGRVAFNPLHTQALVFTKHFCGTNCANGDTWFLERKNESWYVVERMLRQNERDWPLDGLRYLGLDADPKAYRQRRVHGVVTDFETGKVIPGLELKVERPGTLLVTTTNGEGRYSVENLPLGPLPIFAKCPAASGEGWILVVGLFASPGLDSKVNAKLDFAFCAHDR